MRKLRRTSRTACLRRPSSAAISGAAAVVRPIVAYISTLNRKTPSVAAASSTVPSRATKITSTAATAICSRLAPTSGPASLTSARNSSPVVAGAEPVSGARVSGAVMVVRVPVVQLMRLPGRTPAFPPGSGGSRRSIACGANWQGALSAAAGSPRSRCRPCGFRSDAGCRHRIPPASCSRHAHRGSGWNR